MLRPGKGAQVGPGRRRGGADAMPRAASKQCWQSGPWADQARGTTRREELEAAGKASGELCCQREQRKRTRARSLRRLNTRE